MLTRLVSMWLVRMTLAETTRQTMADKVYVKAHPEVEKEILRNLGGGYTSKKGKTYLEVNFILSDGRRCWASVEAAAPVAKAVPPTVRKAAPNAERQTFTLEEVLAMSAKAAEKAAHEALRAAGVLGK